MSHIQIKERLLTGWRVMSHTQESCDIQKSLVTYERVMSRASGSCHVSVHLHGTSRHTYRLPRLLTSRCDCVNTQSHQLVCVNTVSTHSHTNSSTTSLVHVHRALLRAYRALLRVTTVMSRVNTLYAVATISKLLKIIGLFCRI